MTIRISMVIPTYNQRALLRRTLAALCHQTLPRRQFEVIVIDDGGNDNAQGICSAFASQLNIRYFWQRDKGLRAGKARNIGIMAAEGEYLLFIDTGVLLQQDALEQHLNLHQASQHPLVCIGYIYDAEKQTSMEPLINSQDVASSVAYLQDNKAVDIRQAQYDELGYNIGNWPAPFDLFCTDHVSVEKQAVIEAGLFDEAFAGNSGEDIDLGVRLFMDDNKFTLSTDICSIRIPQSKRITEQPSRLGKITTYIHQKYNLWQTAFYPDLYSHAQTSSLNQLIFQHANQEQSTPGTNVAYFQPRYYCPK